MADKFGWYHNEVRNHWPRGEPRVIHIDETFTYQDSNGNLWQAHEGDIVNGANIPWFLRRIFPIFVGLYRDATVLHDVECQRQTNPSWRVHYMFWEAMRCNGVHPVKAWIFWLGVRFCGPAFKGL